jgi:hypothetical protein
MRDSELRGFILEALYNQRRKGLSISIRNSADCPHRVALRRASLGSW